MTSSCNREDDLHAIFYGAINAQARFIVVDKDTKQYIGQQCAKMFNE